MKILVAEDRPAIQEAMRWLMDDWGYDADIVDNGLEAVEKASEKKYDLCLMDLNMPLMGGCEAAKTIRNRIGFIPTLAVTANPSFWGEQNLDAGFDDYMEKPFACNALHEKIIDLTVKNLEIEKRKNRIVLKKETPMSPEHLKELRELAKKGLVKLILRGKGDEFIVHKNVQNKISHDFIAEGKELSVFLDRAEEKPGLCHLYKTNLYANMRCLLPEELEKEIEQENNELGKYAKPIFKKETE